MVFGTDCGVVLGLNGFHGPRRLARVLLADPLAPEQQWEKQLTADDDLDERAILLRFDLDSLMWKIGRPLLTIFIGMENRIMWMTDIRSCERYISLLRLCILTTSKSFSRLAQLLIYQVEKPGWLICWCLD